MTWLCDSTELVSGAWLASAYPGHGVLGANVPSTGTDGPSALYGALSLPADNAVEVRGYMTRWPVNGTLSIAEDGAFNYSGTTDYFDFQLFADGVASTANIGYGAGLSRITLQVGVVSGDVTYPLAGLAQIYPLSGLAQTYPLGGLTQP
jgi:hypothetical protein